MLALSRSSHLRSFGWLDALVRTPWVLVLALLLLSPWAHGQTTVRNVASVAPPAGFTNTNTGGSCTVAGVCSASDTDAVAPSADLSLTKTSVLPSVAVGCTVTFTLVISNAGPSPAVGVTFSDVVPAIFTNVAVQSTAGSVAASVSGNTVNGTATIAVGGTVSVVVRAVAASSGFLHQHRNRDPSRWDVGSESWE